MDKLKNCKRCGRLFSAEDAVNTLCAACQDQDELFFRRLREYVFDHPGISAQQLAEKYNINISKVTRYIREGKLSINSSGF